MVEANLSARLGQIGRLCAARRQLARADSLAASAALVRAEAVARTQAVYRDEALDFWAAVLTDPTAVPQLRAQAETSVVDRERKVHEAERMTAAARKQSEDAAGAFVEANARHEISRTILTQAIRVRDRRLDERQTAEAQDLLLRRNRP